MRVQVALVLLIVILYDGVQGGSTGADSKKLEIIKKEAVVTANLLKDIRITTPQQQTSLIGMANSFRAAISTAVYTLNNVLPSTTKDESYKVLVWSAKTLSTMASAIQTAISNEPKKLKEKLIEILQEINLAVILFEKDFKTRDAFIINQLLRTNDQFITMIFKLKQQTELFLGNNKDLEVALEQNTARLIATVEALPDKKDVSSITQNLADALIRFVSKIKNWVEINPNIGKDLKVLEGTLDGLSSLYKDLNNDSRRRWNLSSPKKQLLKSLKAFSKNLTALGRINLSSCNGAEIITNCMFDALGMVKGYLSILQIRYD